MRRFIIWLAGLIVPKQRRREWRTEWSAELQSMDQTKEAGVFRSLAAFPDALTLWKQLNFDSFLGDLRFAFRSLRRSPVFTAVVVATIALAIGVNSAIFTVIDRVLLRSLPYDEPERIVRIHGENRETGERRLGTSYPDYNDLKVRERAFDVISAYRTSSLILAGNETDPVRVRTASVSEEFRDVVGAHTVTGRWFTNEEHDAGSSNRVLLSNEFWHGRFNADPGVLGRDLELDGQSFTVVGVLPPRYSLVGYTYDVWLPLERRATDDTDNASQDGFGRDWLSLGLLGKISTSTTIASAEADLRRVAAELESEYPATNTGRSVWLESVHEASVGSYRSSLYLLMGAVFAILLIACVNVANLLIGRGLFRTREIAVRSAIGASGVRIVRQLLTESLVLAGIGGATGILLGRWLLDLMMAISPAGLPRATEVSLDARVVIIMLSVTALAGAAFGLVPALQAVRIDLQSGLKEGSRVSDSRRRHRIRSSLVVGEVTLSTVLVAAGVVLFTSFGKVVSVDPGFDASSVLTMRLMMPMDRYQIDENDGWAGTNQFFDELLTNVRALPGVESAAMSYANPLEPSAQFPVGIQVHDAPQQTRSELPRANIYPVTPGFFETFAIPIMRGRAFTSADRKETRGVAVVNQAFARKFFGEDDPIGHRVDNPPFWAPAGYPTASEIVGVVGDVRAAGLTATAPAAIYFPATQTPMGNMRLLVRTADPEGLARPVQNEVWKLDDRLPVDGLTTMEQAIDATIAPVRFPVVLIGLFASMSIVLAALGVYGVTSAAVSERIHELGVRRALGADGTSIMRLVLARGSRTVALGVFLGLAVAWFANKSLQSLVYEVDPGDPKLFAATAVILTLVGLAAGYLPGRRAARVDPVQVLRG